jgi:hypothetical protein
METLSGELIGTLAVTAGLGLLMVRLAQRQNLVERRGEGRRCPACGLLVGRDERCGCFR